VHMAVGSLGLGEVVEVVGVRREARGAPLLVAGLDFWPRVIGRPGTLPPCAALPLPCPAHPVAIFGACATVGQERAEARQYMHNARLQRRSEGWAGLHTMLRAAGERVGHSSAGTMPCCEAGAGARAELGADNKPCWEAGEGAGAELGADYKPFWEAGAGAGAELGADTMPRLKPGEGAAAGAALHCKDEPLLLTTWPPPRPGSPSTLTAPAAKGSLTLHYVQPAPCMTTPALHAHALHAPALHAPALITCPCITCPCINYTPLH